ncbi:hypothetical protein L6452_10377 [Arctium lappa]|uniref:Uncharacterized protein n=1 Tax=Arctium lappa TaxID=4217 RepID=A0ACB9DM55_ARCLA|nr:hypothetical protein L6452_10377 [Arctium lappa]
MSKKVIGGNTGNRERFVWTPQMDDAFVQVMLKEQDKDEEFLPPFGSTLHILSFTSIVREGKDYGNEEIYHLSMANPKFKTKHAKIILGSSSMARRKILAEMGYDFTVMTADIDEKSIRTEKPEDLVLALAEAKADAIISRLGITGHKEENTHPTLLITADTVVVYEGMIREKPSSKEEARHFIKGYSGGCAIVVGSIVVTNLTTGIKKRGWDRSEVYFHDIPDEVIDKLVDDGVTLNVAGGLMLEHPLTAPFVDTVIGTPDGVMGLSKSLAEKLLEESLESW